jgi:hypothetical protein
LDGKRQRSRGRIGDEDRSRIPGACNHDLCTVLKIQGGRMSWG